MSANDRYYPNCPNGQHGYNQYSQYNDPSDRSNNVYASAPGYPLHQHSQHEDSTSSGTVSAPAVAFPASAVAAHQPHLTGFIPMTRNLLRAQFHKPIHMRLVILLVEILIRPRKLALLLKSLTENFGSGLVLLLLLSFSWLFLFLSEYLSLVKQ